MKLRKFLIEHKDRVIGTKPKEGDVTAWANNVNNVLFSFASNKPTQFGTYQYQMYEDIDEMLAYYQDDIYELCKVLDGDGITRLAQTMYLLKTANYENIWWRIENRVHELAEEKQGLDAYNVVNILRSFSRS